MKTTTKTLIAFGMTSALALGSLAYAQKGPHPRGDRGAAMLEQLDTNGDGAISQAEVDAKRAAEFSAADSNGDGAVSLDELTAHREAKRAEMKAKREAAMFAKMDVNGNGVIDPDEFGGRADKMFDRFDTDEDGLITAEEREAAKEKRGKRWKERRERRGGE